MKERAARKILVRVGLLFVLVFSAVPFMWMVLISFSESPDFLIRQTLGFTWNNYAGILQEENLHFLYYLRNSLIVAAGTAVLSTLVGALAAYGLSRVSFRGKLFIVLSVLALSMFPQISFVGYLYWFMAEIGWINSYPALIFPYAAWTLPFAMWMLLSYFSRIPVEIDQAALVDGASRFQVLGRIILPISLPAFLSTGLLVFMLAFNEFLFALMLTTDFHARTVTVGIALFQGLHGEIPWGYIMAASALSSIPLILIVLFSQRFFIQGLTGGAVKE
jgi:multiple sugar transport system permease protein